MNSLNPLSANITKWANTLKHDKLPTNCLSVFDHFVGLALKGLNEGNLKEKTWSRITKNSNKSVRSYVQKLLFYVFLNSYWNMKILESKIFDSAVPIHISECLSICSRFAKGLYTLSSPSPTNHLNKLMLITAEINTIF